MLWLALRFRDLPLEVLAAGTDPLAVVERHVVVAANAAADAAGVAAGMGLASALGMLPGLHLHERDATREVAAMHRLACWAGGFSPHVVLDGVELLIEIGACLRLFGGIDALCARVRAGLRAQGHAPVLALAPTPLAAQWLARAPAVAETGMEGVCLDRSLLRDRLAPLPVDVIELPPAQQDVLAACGLRTLGGLFIQPAAGLERRTGARLPLLLARALGQIVDPRPGFVFPERFVERLELPAPVEFAPALEFAAGRLLAALGGWLAVRQAGVRRCRLQIAHERRAASGFELVFATPTRDPQRLRGVLRERLQRLRLPAPAMALSLDVEHPEPLPGYTPSLLERRGAGSGDGGEDAGAAVVDRLRARLGVAAVHGLRPRADHRPECATQPLDHAPPLPEPSVGAPARPLWLLAEPQPLADAALPRRLTRAERIESGWWDAGLPGATGDVRREYHVALGPDGAWWWIFRDAEGWWLHGMFA